MSSGLLSRLSVQIALGPVLVIVLVGAAMLWRVDSDLHVQAEQRFSERVQLASMQIDDRVKNELQLRGVNASVLAGQRSFVTELEENDISAAIQAAAQFMGRAAIAQSGASGVRVYAPNGILLGRAEGTQNATQRAVPAEVLEAIRTNRVITTVRMDETLGLAVSGISPVQSSTGQTIGAVEAISALDATFARSAATFVDTDVSVVSGGRVATSSESGTPFDPGAINDFARATAKTEPAHLGVGDREYIAGIVTYRDRNGAIIGDILVGIDQAKVSATVTETRSSILRTMVTATLITTAAAWTFGWLALRPMAPLLAAAKRLQQNDLESPVPARGPTELRQLGEAMEDMRLAIRQSRDALQTANSDLASRISSSDASLSEVTQDLDVMQAVVAQFAGDSAGGLPGVAEEMLELGWVDGAFIALATESGDLSTAAVAGLPPGAASAVLGAIESRLMTTEHAEFIIEDTATDAATSRLAVWLIRGLAVAPMTTPDGIAGVVCVTSNRHMSLTPQRRELLRSIAHEITSTLERSELADEVEENRRVAETVLREMADGVLVIDHNNVCQICNPAAARFLGLTRAQIIGRHAEEWFPMTESHLESMRERVTAGVRGVRAPVVVEAAGFQLAITAGPFPDPDPNRAGLILLLRDLSAEADAERVKRDFVSMVGHELRTPLTLIRTTIDLLHGNEAGELNTTQARIVQVLRQNSDRLMSLISDLLDMSALDSGRMQITPVATNLAEIVNRAAAGVQDSIEEHRHVLRVIVPDDVTVWADPARIEQVVSNLLSNAIKYTPPGGQILVRVTDTQPFAIVSVSDSGIGIPPEEQGQLFEKFYRTTSGRRTTGGTGLGLAIAKSIVDLHGGTIRCDSDGQSGTTFTFTLPRRPL